MKGSSLELKYVTPKQSHHHLISSENYQKKVQHFNTHNEFVTSLMSIYRALRNWTSHGNIGSSLLPNLRLEHYKNGNIAAQGQRGHKVRSRTLRLFSKHQFPVSHQPKIQGMQSKIMDKICPWFHVGILSFRSIPNNFVKAILFMVSCRNFVL